MNCVNKLLNALGETCELKKDDFSEYIAFRGIGKAYSKRWLANIVPADLLKLPLKKSVEIIATLSESGIFYEKFPDKIQNRAQCSLCYSGSTDVPLLWNTITLCRRVSGNTR